MKKYILLILLTGIQLNSFCQNKQLKFVNESNSFQMDTKQIGQCNQFLPMGWTTQTNPEGTSLDITSPDKTMYAGFIVFPMMKNMQNFYPNNELYNSNPEVVIVKLASLISQTLIGYEDKFYIDNSLKANYGNYILTKLYSNNFKGSILYRIMPGDGVNTSNYIALRITIAKPSQWSNFQDLLSRIAFSIRCEAKFVEHDYPIVKARISSNNHKNINRSKEDDYNYNAQLGTEEAHNPDTGANYTFTQDAWNETGPQGPGYYVPSGNSIIKLSPGRAKQ
jgi:hypothetical protein